MGSSFHASRISLAATDSDSGVGVNPSEAVRLSAPAASAMVDKAPNQSSTGTFFSWHTELTASAIFAIVSSYLFAAMIAFLLTVGMGGVRAKTFAPVADTRSSRPSYSNAKRSTR